MTASSPPRCSTTTARRSSLASPCARRSARCASTPARRRRTSIAASRCAGWAGPARLPTHSRAPPSWIRATRGPGSISGARRWSRIRGARPRRSAAPPRPTPARRARACWPGRLTPPRGEGRSRAASARAAALARQPGLLEDLRRAVTTAVDEQDPDAASQASLLVEAISPSPPVRRLALAQEPQLRAQLRARRQRATRSERLARGSAVSA